MNSAFVQRIKEHLDEALIIREGLWHEGPQLIDKAQGVLKLSLRGLARESHLSPTYLSRVMHGHEILSAGSYLKIHDLIVKAK